MGLEERLAPSGVERIRDIIRLLRGENGCPWDRVQTEHSMMSCLLEETYELAEGIEKNDIENIVEEIGDVLFQLLFIAVLYDEKKIFAFEDVIKASAEKMIRRHPHVFGEGFCATAEEAVAQWGKIKKGEKDPNEKRSVLDRIPKNMPALLRAFQVSEKAAKCNFDWPDLPSVMNKTAEEWSEFGQALKEGDKESAKMEFGDILFTLVNVARWAEFDPEIALVSSTAKFESRFRKMEDIVHEKGLTLEDIPRDEVECLWDSVKSHEK